MNFIVFFILFFVIYILMNWWVGLRGWQSLIRHIPFVESYVYWPLFWLLALSFPAGRFGRDFLPSGVGSAITLAGSFWFGAVLYFVMALLAVDTIRFLGRVTGLISRDFSIGILAAAITGLVVVILVSGVFVYGWWNARNTRISNYQIHISKQAGELEKMRVVVVSDLHLGTIVNRNRLDRLVEMVNRLEPDLVLLPGDIIEETPGPFVDQDMAASLRRLNTRFGVYAVPGNHEYIGRKFDEIVKSLQEAGIEVLVDRHIKVADSFYIVGRDDRSGERFTGKKRRDMTDLMAGLNPSLPVILMEHQPSIKGQEPEKGVDLKVSGHTHRGQFFPFNLITSRMYEIDWGHLRTGGFNSVVTSGFGTFGPPIRVGSRPEVVKLDIVFGKE
ncbi:MAG: metallophosphoesterase [Bacillota bacterium]